MIQRRVLQAFEEEQEKSKLPDYIRSYDDYGEERYACLGEDGEESIDRSYILPVDESLRRRDHGVTLPQPHAAALAGRRNGEPAQMSLMTAADDNPEEAFGAGLV